MKYNKRYFITASYNSSLSKEKFDDMNKDNVLGEEQKKGLGVFNDGVYLGLFGFNEENRALIEVEADYDNPKDALNAINKFKKNFKAKFNEDLKLDFYTKGFKKSIIKE